MPIGTLLIDVCIMYVCNVRSMCVCTTSNQMIVRSMIRCACKRLALVRICSFCPSQAAKDAQQVKETTHSRRAQVGYKSPTICRMLREGGLRTNHMGFTSSYRTTRRRGASREDPVWADQQRWWRLWKHSLVANEQQQWKYWAEQQNVDERKWVPYQWHHHFHI